MHTEDIISGLVGSIAIVGNGQLGHYGKAIDKHDTVIRINNFRLSRYRQLCGSRTTLWCTHVQAYARQSTKMQNIPAINPATQAQSQIGIFKKYHAKITYARKSFDTLGVESPTTGFLLVLLAVKIGKKVDIFGFDGLKTGHYWNPKHIHVKKHKDGLKELNILREISLVRMHT